MRAELRVLLRGPPAHRGHGGGPHPGRPAGGGILRYHQALRLQQPGGEPNGGVQQRGRTGPAGDLPPGLRGGGPGRGRQGGHDLLQPAQRRLRPQQPRPLHQGPAPGVGLRRGGDDRLERHHGEPGQQRRRPPGGQRSDHARRERL